MTIVVKCFASLREQLGVAEQALAYREGMRIRDAWEGICQEPPMTNMLSACNMEYVDFDHKLDDGDEVAFFPPVTGG